jgi:DNA invertase Pin-like site-specific DNA recombinase
VTPGDPRRAVGYLRVSTDEQQLGPDAQRAAVERWAELGGVEVVAWHEDRVSGAAPLDARVGLLAALEDLRRLGAGVLVAQRRDRVARDVVLAAQVEQLTARLGARVATADGADAGDGPEAVLFRRLLDAFAEFERALIRSRTRSALAVRRRRGDRYSHAPPLGSRFAGVDAKGAGGVLEVDDAERRTLERMRDLRAGGHSLAAIARRLNLEGVASRGVRWHKTTVARVLGRAS